jgi:hypothetical protein
MTTARDNISQIIDEMVRYDGFMGAWDAQEAADAIMVALPSMVAPLVWQRSGSHWDSRYGHVIQKHKERYLLICPNIALRYCDELSEAKIAANTHHCAHIMAAFETPTITP